MEILKTERLRLREMAQADFGALAVMLQNERVMAAYEHAFSDREVQAWLDRQRGRYAQYGFGLWLCENAAGEVIGQCGLSMQPAAQRGEVLEVGYLFAQNHWGNGYAAEAARACRDYAFQNKLGDEVFSIIRDNNYPSMRVAIRGGMLPRFGFVKHYHGVDMPHIAFSITQTEWTNLKG